MTDHQRAISSEVRNFERKVGLSRAALVFEHLWPRLWLVIGVLALFMLVSLAGLWPWLSPVAHKLVLAAFIIMLGFALAAVLRVRLPTREEALRRLEQRSGIPHRPASSYEDTIVEVDDPTTKRIWEAHKARLAALLARLRVGPPAPRTDRRDPFALRALLMLGVALFLGLVGDSAKDRLWAAFRFAPESALGGARLDAWVTPPAYTAKPPVLLADGGQSGVRPTGDSGPITVPDKSVLIVRMTGPGTGPLSVELTPEGGQKTTLSQPQPKSTSDVAEARAELRSSGTVQVMSSSGQVARWTFKILPDQPPRITLTKQPERTARGALRLTYRIEDDYGVSSAEARFDRLKKAQGDPRTSWARADILKGPRLPLERPPVLALRLPRQNAKEAETTSFHELGANPWAGTKLVMTLQAKDLGGNIGRSLPVEVVLPQRRFSKDLAKAVVELRRKLVEDSRYRPLVMKALDAVTLDPEDFIPDRHVYLGLRSAYYRLSQDRTRVGLKSVVDQLWHVALRIEDGGDLTDAERRLREIQDQLSKALEEGASDEEIKRLMQELRQALNEFMQQLARQAENNPAMQLPEGFNPNQIVRQEDLDRMLNNLENMARQGSREMAQEMLSQLRDMLEQLQSGRMANMGQMGQQGQQMMQMMDQFGDLIGRQQRLYDDTFGEQRRQGDRGQQGQGQQGQRGQGQQGQRGNRQGQQGQGPQGQGQQQGQGQGQQPGGSQPGPGELGERQGQLRDRLGQIRRGMGELGMRAPSQLEGAEQSMDNAQRALEQGDLDTATREQSRALEQLRQGAQSMAEQMMRQMPSRFGMGPAADAPRDPLGRPQRSEGPDLGTSVKVPDEIDTQRAREILEELRRRLGEATRPPMELDYIERLLRRF